MLRGFLGQFHPFPGTKNSIYQGDSSMTGDTLKTVFTINIAAASETQKSAYRKAMSKDRYHYLEARLRSWVDQALPFLEWQCTINLFFSLSSL